MGLGIVCSVIVLILLVGLGYYVKRAQDKKIERLGEKIGTKLVRLEQRLDDLERLPDEQSSE
jgi:prefoldin subunit 5